MDYINLPMCALLRKGSLTVPVRMEASGVQCCCPEINPKDLPEAVDRLTKCEQCSRTRSIRKFSDCDSEIVNKSLPYRSRHARTRYVNVCAAVCLLLLVVDSVPRTFAAPRRRSAMEEDQLWGNPCDVDEQVENVNLNYDTSMPGRIEKLLNIALRDTDSYKDLFAKNLLGLNSYNDLLAEWSNYKWMEKWVMDKTWLRDEVVPKKKSPEELKAYLTPIVEKDVDKILPSLHKGLKLVLAAMNMVSNSLPPSGPNPTNDLADKMKGTKTKLRSALCEFTEMMAARHLNVLPLYHSELPVLSNSNNVKDATLVFRDTIDYLQYLGQFMNIMSSKK